MNLEPLRSVHFRPDILFLPDHRFALQLQLNGQTLDSMPSDLANGIDTDMIIPADACKYPDPHMLSDFVLTGWKHGLIGQGEIKNLWSNVWVAGKNYGSGSSREHAPIAMMGAGCCLVITESVAPIFARNAVNLGLYISADFSLIPRIRSGEPIPLEELSANLDPLSAQIVRTGGLLPYLSKKQNGEVLPPQIYTSPRPMTVAEKWLSRYLNVPYVKPGDGGFARPNVGYSYEYTVPLSVHILKSHLGSDVQIHDPTQLVFFNDHLSLDDIDPRSQELEKITRDFALNQGIKIYDTVKNPDDGQQLNAICHLTMLDKAQPGFIVGTDSHTTMLGLLGYPLPIGATDAAGLMLTGEVLVVVPETALITLQGKLNPLVTPRDLMLYLVAENGRNNLCSGRVIQFGGDLSQFTVSDLSVFANSAAEMRAVTATFPPLFQVAEFLVKTHRAGDVNEALNIFPEPDPDADYAVHLSIDLSVIEPMVAVPDKPDKGIPLKEVPYTEINKVNIGSCIGGGIEDLMLVARMLHGKKISEHVRLFVQPNNIAALKYATQAGWIRWIEEAGAVVIKDMGCGACIGVGPGVLEKGDVCFTNDTRNHVGRMGHESARVYLGNTMVATAAALLGHNPSMSELLSLSANLSSL